MPYHDTVTDILAMAPLLAGLSVQVFGGIALNSQNGGLNPFAVDRSLKMGGKVIWFPTISSRAHLRYSARDEDVRAHFQPRGMMQARRSRSSAPTATSSPRCTRSSARPGRPGR